MDGLRGLLSLWVVLAHVFCWCGFAETPFSPSAGGAHAAFIHARIPVEIFIILSGFAISFLLNERRPSYVSFMVGRVFRIYPVFLVCFFLGVAAAHFSPFVLHHAPWKESNYFEPLRAISVQEHTNMSAHIWAHLTLLNGLLTKDMLPDSSATFLSPAWSITLEWQYYLVAPLIARLVRSNLGLLCVGVAAWFGLEYGDLWKNPFPAFFPAHLTLFLIGIGSYHLFAHVHRETGRTGSLFQRGITYLVVAAVAIWFSIPLAAWSIVFGCIVVNGSDAFARGLGIVRQALQFRVLQWLGRISFPLYLVHWPVIIFLVWFVLQIHSSATQGCTLLCMLVLGTPIILAAACFLHRYVEAPMMAAGKRAAGRTNEKRPSE